MDNYKYLFIGLIILLLIGLFSKSPEYKQEPKEPTQTTNKNVVVVNGPKAPPKYGYVPPPAYNPYKNQYYN